MEDEEREDLLIRTNSDNDECTDNEDGFETSRGNTVQHENKINTLFEKVQFICLGALLCLSSTALIILLPLYLEAVDKPGDVYTALLFTSCTSILIFLVATCFAGKLWKGVKARLLPPFAFSIVSRIGLIYGVGCFLVLFSVERKKVICHLQDPIKGIVLVFSLVYYFFFCRKMMSLQKIFCSTTIIVGLFISVDYGLCDEFRCRGHERESRSEDAGDWSWRSHAVWTFTYILGLALWSLHYTLLEGHLVTTGVLTFVGTGNSRLATVSRLVSTQDNHSHSRPLLQLTEESQDLPSQDQGSNAPTEQRRHITFMKQHFFDSHAKPHALAIALWLHIIAALVILSLCWADMTDLLGKGSSIAEFWNLTHTGLHCHFGRYENCYGVTTYAWPFLIAYVLFVASSLKFLIISESAVFTVAMATTALPLSGVWWSLFRMTGPITQRTTGLLDWYPVVTGELICSILGIPIVLTGIVLLCKAHFKERSYGKVAIACLRQ